MADVSLEQGYVRLPNRLLEAILAAPFSGAQLRILLALFRLTRGWRRRTVKLTETELASYAGMAPGADARRAGGTFRQALKALVKADVVLRVEGARGSRKITFAIEPDYARWGGYSVAEGRLVATWNIKPEADDPALSSFAVQTSLDDMARNEATFADDESDATWPDTGPTQDGDMAQPRAISQAEPEPTWPDTGPSDGPTPGHVDGSKSLFDETLPRGKDRKDSIAPSTSRTPLPQQTAARAAGGKLARVSEERPDADDTEVTRQYAIKLSTAVNNAITKRWGEQPSPITYATGLDLAGELRKANVPIALARVTIDSVVMASKQVRPMSTISYFRQPILEAAREAEQRELNQQDAGTRRGGNPASIAAVVDPERTKREQERQQQEERDYLGAQRTAALEWRNNPRHSAALSAIVARIDAKFAGHPDSGWVKTAREEMLVAECAKAARFPDRDTWIRAHTERTEHTKSTDRTVGAA